MVYYVTLFEQQIINRAYIPRKGWHHLEAHIPGNERRVRQEKVAAQEVAASAICSRRRKRSGIKGAYWSLIPPRREIASAAVLREEKMPLCG